MREHESTPFNTNAAVDSELAELLENFVRVTADNPAPSLIEASAMRESAGRISTAMSVALGVMLIVLAQVPNEYHPFRSPDKIPEAVQFELSQEAFREHLRDAAFYVYSIKQNQTFQDKLRKAREDPPAKNPALSGRVGLIDDYMRELEEQILLGELAMKSSNVLQYGPVAQRIERVRGALSRVNAEFEKAWVGIHTPGSKK